MAGNTSGSVQYNGGLFLGSKNYINITSGGELIYTYTINNPFSNNQYFFGGLGQYGVAGIGVTIQGGDYVYITNYKTGLISCSTDKKGLDSSPHTIRIVASRNIVDTDYNVYYDGLIWCSITQTSTITNLAANFTFVSAQNNYHSLYIDNVYFTDGTTTSALLNEGAWCQTGEDCISGNCEYHYCTLKSGGAECLQGSECLTGSCTGGRCDRADLFTQVNYAKKQIVGDSIATNNLLALSIIFGLAIVVLMLGGANILSGGVAMGIVFMGSIFFTIIGYLSPFIMIGVVLTGLILVVFAFVITSGG